MNLPLGAVLVPPDSQLAGRVDLSLAHAGRQRAPVAPAASVQDALAGASLALWDLTHPRAKESAALLKEAALTRGVQVIAIVEQAEELGDAVGWLTDFVTRSQLETELPFRLRQAERRESALRFQDYFAHSAEGTVVTDGEGVVLALNPAGAELFQTTPDAARGYPLARALRPKDGRVLSDLLHAASLGETLRDVDVSAQTQDGKLLLLSVHASPVLDGSPNGSVILTLRDVTVSRQTSEELKQTKDFLERLIDSSVDAIVAADLRGKILLFSKGAEDILGYRASDALANLNVRDIYPPGTQESLMARLRSQENGGPGRLNMCREELVTRVGERIPVNLTASILYEDGVEAATVGIFSDLRGLMQLEQKLSDAQSRLEESERNAVIVALAGTAAHELNQPLTSVMGYAELLRRKLKEDDFAFRPVDIIYREAERMAELVRRIGKITRYETKTYVGSSEIIDLDKASANDE